MNTLYSGKLLKGQYHLEWKMDNATGSIVEKGIYLLTISADDFSKNSVFIVN